MGLWADDATEAETKLLSFSSFPHGPPNPATYSVAPASTPNSTSVSLDPSSQVFETSGTCPTNPISPNRHSLKI